MDCNTYFRSPPMEVTNRELCVRRLGNHGLTLKVAASLAICNAFSTTTFLHVCKQFKLFFRKEKKVEIFKVNLCFNWAYGSVDFNTLRTGEYVKLFSFVTEHTIFQLAGYFRWTPLNRIPKVRKKLVSSAAGLGQLKTMPSTYCESQNGILVWELKWQ